MDYEQVQNLLERIQRPASEHNSKGETLIWSHADGTAVGWTEVVNALTQLLETLPKPKVFTPIAAVLKQEDVDA